ncbi:MAG: GNAT family N-acetyltransferase [Clostridia bacterium]|nr:GNAT family N-acetyltransferase [Clostridia bacterium]
MLEWMHDRELCAGFRFDGSHATRESACQFIGQSMSETNRHYAIVDEQDEYLGTISLKHIDENGAEYAIALRKKAISTGIAREATKELLRIAFDTLGLKMVYLNVLEDNTRAIKSYEKSGFLYREGKDSTIQIKDVTKKLKWYVMEKEQYEKIR